MKLKTDYYLLIPKIDKNNFVKQKEQKIEKKVFFDNWGLPGKNWNYIFIYYLI